MAERKQIRRLCILSSGSVLEVRLGVTVSGRWKHPERGLQEDRGGSALLYSAHRRQRLLTRHENIQVIADKFNQHKETDQRGKERTGGYK